MSGVYTEADYENTIIELFRHMGWQYVYGPDLERDYHDPLYEDELEGALHRINPTMPESAIQDALFKLKNFENADLIQKNAAFTDYIQHGVEVRYLRVKKKGQALCIWWITRIRITILLSLPISGHSLRTAIKGRIYFFS